MGALAIRPGPLPDNKWPSQLIQKYLQWTKKYPTLTKQTFWNSMKLEWRYNKSWWSRWNSMETSWLTSSKIYFVDGKLFCRSFLVVFFSSFFLSVITSYMLKFERKPHIHTQRKHCLAYALKGTTLHNMYRRAQIPAVRNKQLKLFIYRRHNNQDIILVPKTSNLTCAVVFSSVPSVQEFNIKFWEI